MSGRLNKSDSDLVWQIQLMIIKGWKFSTHTQRISNSNCICQTKSESKKYVVTLLTSYFMNKKRPWWKYLWANFELDNFRA